MDLKTSHLMVNSWSTAVFVCWNVSSHLVKLIIDTVIVSHQTFIILKYSDYLCYIGYPG
jgi:hypothetical protein